MPLPAALLLFLAAIAAVPTASNESDKEVHCVAFVVGQTSDGELVLTDPECFDTEDDATMLADRGPADSSSSGFGMAGSTFTLGRHFDGFNATGSSISIVGSSCTGGYWNTSSA